MYIIINEGRKEGRKEGMFVLFNGASRAYWFSYHWLLDVKHMVIGTYFFRVLFPLNGKGSFICTFPPTGHHIPQPLMAQLWTTGWNGK